MTIVGLNFKYAELPGFRKKLKDGAICIIDGNGDIQLAIAEERVSRVKHDGGHELALEEAYKALPDLMKDVKIIVGSRCCEPLSPKGPVSSPNDYVNNTWKTLIPSHHLSHAYSTFFSSPFPEALIAIIDAGGSLLESSNEGEWWKVSREQSSYYIGHGKDIKLIDRDFAGPSEAGLGEIFRAFTYYLGWHSYTYSANTMALAAYGNPNRFENVSLFTFRNGRLRSSVINTPLEPIRMISDWAEHSGVKLPPPRHPDDNIIGHQHEKDYYDLAAFVQRELEKALILKITYLSQKTGLAKLCIAGGVGLNCVANRKILDNTPITDIFIFPASGDDGQAVGNAYYGHYTLLDNERKIGGFSPYLGFKYELQINEVVTFFEKEKADVLIAETTTPSRHAAELIFAKQIIGWYQGRSEYGPRALGNRSILSDPRSLRISERLRRCKKRELFRPFAPSILEEEVDSFFDIPIPSPYMLLVAYAKPLARKLVPPVIHVDGTSRIQTVSKVNNPLYYELITHFKELSGIPLVLNTSFNSRGEPIVEKPTDAFKTFLEMDMDTLVIENIIIQKINENRAVLKSLLPQFLQIDLTKITPMELRDILLQYFDISLSDRQYMNLFDEYVDWVRSGRKTTTIRFTHGSIDYPVSFTLPLFSTDKHNREKIRQDGYVKLLSMRVKHFGSLTNEDSYNDGFLSLDELKDALRFIYGDIGANEYVTIYTIQLI